ncbi:hypothetical protein [Pseudarthrobacter sulfonivorans]|uniref:hypothetical protein n=1 Tax=Pseudarthrobacter sulfonivorans TaxID=121292 RepID=UPI00168BDCC1|nr:hypothetical protein [Pseudarthrobacter sulfonivorans]
MRTVDAFLQSAPGSGRRWAHRDICVPLADEAIASESGVALQTVYNSVGNKAALLSAVLDSAASGPHSPSNVLELMRKRTAEAADFDALIAVLADWFVEVHRRTGPVVGSLPRPPPSTPPRRSCRPHALQRLERYGEAAAAVRARGGLQSGMSDADAAAAIWSPRPCAAGPSVLPKCPARITLKESS